MIERPGNAIKQDALHLVFCNYLIHKLTASLGNAMSPVDP